MGDAFDAWPWRKANRKYKHFTSHEYEYATVTPLRWNIVQHFHAGGIF